MSERLTVRRVAAMHAFQKGSKIPSMNRRPSNAAPTWGLVHPSNNIIFKIVHRHRAFPDWTPPSDSRSIVDCMRYATDECVFWNSCIKDATWVVCDEWTGNCSAYTRSRRSRRYVKSSVNRYARRHDSGRVLHVGRYAIAKD
jgi:hypothetical protein